MEEGVCVCLMNHVFVYIMWTAGCLANQYKFMQGT